MTNRNNLSSMMMSFIGIIILVISVFMTVVTKRFDIFAKIAICASSILLLLVAIFLVTWFMGQSSTDFLKVFIGIGFPTLVLGLLNIILILFSVKPNVGYTIGTFLGYVGYYAAISESILS